ncbi:hypothetical protein FD754_010338 [Muntiacus muntjak]|uniref:CUT domain-containing protein n=1 Tax=Muntiacus muntjak TaxID=9888 RepID=A0A5N3WWE4_MUNMU|nr:hypothetical protein FD754_010338 [Muntiacus muntjak]
MELSLESLGGLHGVAHAQAGELLSPSHARSAAAQHRGLVAPGRPGLINTKEVAQRITAELKRYSIPQAIFAQRILCRSQGTLSDLLRNPKPWSKLKSGRETFRRMWKWLQEPEFQRMSALRLAGLHTPAAPLPSPRGCSWLECAHRTRLSFPFCVSLISTLSVGANWYLFLCSIHVFILPPPLCPAPSLPLSASSSYSH